MQLSGSHIVAAPRQRVWEALQDPGALVATLPGCRRLEAVADDTYAVTVELGVASITGTYLGEVALADQRPPSAYTIRAKGQGGPGTVDAIVEVRLEPEGPEATRVSYEADAAVGGTIAGVGQRVLASAAKRTAAEFFGNVERELTQPAAAAAGPAEVGADRDVPAGVAEPAQRRVWEAPRPAAAGAEARALLLAAAAGAALALLGVLVGRRAR